MEASRDLGHRVPWSCSNRQLGAVCREPNFRLLKKQHTLLPALCAALSLSLEVISGSRDGETAGLRIVRAHFIHAACAALDTHGSNASLPFNNRVLCLSPSHRPLSGPLSLACISISDQRAVNKHVYPFQYNHLGVQDEALRGLSWLCPFS